MENPQSPIEWGRLGKLYMAHQFVPEAIACFEAAAKLDSLDPRWPYFQAVLFEESDLETSAARYAETLAIKPESAIARFRLAQVLIRLGQYDKAQTELQKVQVAAPKEAAIRLTLARLAIVQSNWDEAEKYLQAAARQAPHSREVFQELSRLAAHQKRWADAVEFQRASQFAAGNPVSLEDKWLQEVTELELSGHPLADQADRFLAEGQLNAAVKALRSVVHDHPELVRAHVNLAVALWQLGRLDEAEREFKKLVLEFPDEATTYLTWGRLLATSGRFQEAKLRFEQAIDRKADTAEGCSMLGSVLERSGQLEDAVVWFQRSIRAAPQVSSTYLSLASVFCQLGQTSSAENSLSLAANLAHNDEGAKAEIARLRQRIDDMVKANASRKPDSSQINYDSK